MKNVLKWIAVIPASFAVFGVARIAQSILTLLYMPDLIDYLNSHRDFGPWHVLGPLYALSSHAISVTAGMVAAQKIAPAGKSRIALFITAGIWIIFEVISIIFVQSHPGSGGASFRAYLEMAGELLGIAISFTYRLDK